ncbi:MAG: TPM domain-containing protein, partial [Armatimonadota bacterium]|nr:TPM domain-containing protein [Armatimonadota bacterium]
MKCPRCGLITEVPVPQCLGCAFSIASVDRFFRQVPKRDGFVNDWTKALTPEQLRILDENLKNLSAQLNGEIVVVLIQTTKPVKPSEYVFWLFNRWQVGGPDQKGVMILIAFKERRVESEVGYGWEPILSDLESGQILDNLLVPHLREGKVYEGL